MFTRRNDIPSDDVVRRQRVVLGIVLGRTKQPITVLEKRAAVYARHGAINAITRFTLLKRIDVVRRLAAGVHFEPTLRQTLRRLLADPVIPDYGDTLTLPLTPPTLVSRPTPVEPYNFDLRIKRSSRANLREFEDLVFDGKRVRYRYYGDTSFAAYLYQNLMHVLAVRSVNELLGNRDWRARMALLLDETNLNEEVAREAFSADRVAYRGRFLDTSFVPEYDAYSVRPMTRIDTTADRVADARSTKEWLEFEPSLAVQRSKTPNAFAFFPFKNGYYVQVNGPIVYLDIPRTKSRLADAQLRTIGCVGGELEYAMSEISRTITLQDAISLAVNATTIEEAGLTLMILRRMTGDRVRVKTYTVTLPDEHDMLSWMRIPCRDRYISRDRKLTIMLPIENPPNETTLLSVATVRDIARSCFSAVGACILSSSYCFLELDLYAIYIKLKNDAEKYVFFTIIMQYHASNLILLARSQLKPIFGQDATIDVVKTYQPNARTWIDRTMSDRMRDRTVELLRPNDLNVETSRRPDCTDVELCPDQYAFADEKLRALVDNIDDDARDDISYRDFANDDEYAAFVSLFVSN